MWDTLAENRNVLLGIIVVLVLLTMTCSAGVLNTLLGVEKDALRARKSEGMLDPNLGHGIISAGANLPHQGVLGHTGATNARSQRWSDIAHPLQDGFTGHMEPPVFYDVGNLADAHRAVAGMMGPGRSAAAPGQNKDGLVDDRQLLPALAGH